MKEYNNIILAVELDAGCDTVPAKKAVSLAKEFGAKLSLLHAVEHMTSYGAAYGIVAGADIEEMLLENAREAMSKFGKELGIAQSDQIIKVGPAKFVILEEAKDLKADLIIVGSHGRHGVRLLLGSTANAVLHGAKCDVLAVRIPDEK